MASFSTSTISLHFQVANFLIKNDVSLENLDVWAKVKVLDLQAWKVLESEFSDSQAEAFKTVEKIQGLEKTFWLVEAKVPFSRVEEIRELSYIVSLETGHCVIPERLSDTKIGVVGSVNNVDAWKGLKYWEEGASLGSVTPCKDHTIVTATIALGVFQEIESEPCVLNLGMADPIFPA